MRWDTLLQNMYVWSGVYYRSRYEYWVGEPVVDIMRYGEREYIY